MTAMCRICHKQINDPNKAEDNAHKDCILKQGIQNIQRHNRFDPTGQDDENDMEA